MSRKYVLIALIELYLALTIIIYISGPIRYDTQNEFLLYFLLTVFQLVLFVGYFVAERISNRKQRTCTKNKIYSWIDKNIIKLVVIALTISVFYSIMWMVRYSDTFSPIEIIRNVINGIKDPSEAYYKNMQMNNKPQIMGSFITVTSTLLVGFYYIGIPLGVYFFKKLNILSKILVIVAIVLEASTYIMKGTNIGIFRVGLSVISVLILKWIQTRSIKKNNSKKELIIKIVSVLILLLLVISYFTYSTTDRMNYKIPETISNIPIDLNNSLLSLVPNNLKYGFIMIDFYLTQGYYGMSNALGYDFISTYGIGNSAFLIENLEDIFHVNIYERTYQYRMKDIWNDRVNWHTAYTWFANDVSFLGVIPLMFLLGFMIYKVVSGAKNRNIFAIVLLPLYAQMIVFLSANNSVLSNPMTFMPFVLIHFMWLITNIKSKKIEAKEVNNEK